MIIRQKNEENESNTKQNVLENVLESNESAKNPENQLSFELNKSGQNIKKTELNQRSIDSKNKDKSIKQKTPSKLLGKPELIEDANISSNNGKIKTDPVLIQNYKTINDKSNSEKNGGQNLNENLNNFSEVGEQEIKLMNKMATNKKMQQNFNMELRPRKGISKKRKRLHLKCHRCLAKDKYNNYIKCSSCPNAFCPPCTQIYHTEIKSAIDFIRLKKTPWGCPACLHICSCRKCLAPPKLEPSKDNPSDQNNEDFLEIVDWRETKELYPKKIVNQEKKNPPAKRTITLAQLDSSGGSSYRPRNRKSKKRKEKKKRKSLFCAQLEVDSEEENSNISEENESSNIKSDQSSIKNEANESDQNQKSSKNEIHQEEEENRENRQNENINMPQSNIQQNFLPNPDFRQTLMPPFCIPTSIPSNFVIPPTGFPMHQLMSRPRVNMGPIFIPSPLMFNPNFRPPTILRPRNLDFVPRYSSRVLFNPMNPICNPDPDPRTNNNNQKVDQNYILVPLQVPENPPQINESNANNVVLNPEEKKSIDS